MYKGMLAHADCAVKLFVKASLLERMTTALQTFLSIRQTRRVQHLVKRRPRVCIVSAVPTSTFCNTTVPVITIEVSEPFCPKLHADLKHAETLAALGNTAAPEDTSAQALIAKTTFDMLVQTTGSCCSQPHRCHGQPHPCSAAA